LLRIFDILRVDCLRKNDILYQQIRERYPDAYRCVLKVKKYIKENCDIELTNEEMTYFMLHINRVCSRIKS